MLKAPDPIVASSNDEPERSITTNAVGHGRNAVRNTGTTSSSSKPSQGWYMVILVFIANFLVFGFFKSLGMLAKILNKEFGFGSTMNVYILMCITYSLNCAAGPLSCYLTTRYSARTMALIGTSMVTVGLMLSWFAKSLAVLYFSVGIMTGVGSGLTYPTGIILVSSYFIDTKNTAIANALVISGSPIGGMVMPYVLSFLSEFYTSRGAFLIIGGLMMHAVLCVRSFQQPGETARGRKKEDIPSPSPPPNTPRCECPNNVKLEEPIVNDCQEAKMKADNCTDHNVIKFSLHSCSTGILHVSGEFSGERGTTASMQTVQEFNACHINIGSAGLCPVKSNVGETDGVTIDNDFGLTNRRRPSISVSQSLKERETQNTANPYYAAVAGSGSKPYLLALDHSCIILCTSNNSTVPQDTTEAAKHFGVADDKNFNLRERDKNNIPIPLRTPDKTTRSKCKCISPLSEPLYIFLLISNTATAISTANIYLMLAQLVKEEDDTDFTKTSLVYLLLSFADLTGRIMGALMCDIYYVPPSAIYPLGLLSAGASSSVLSSLTTYHELCFGTFLYGLSTGFHTGVYGLLLTNIVGLHKIHAGYGYSLLINGSIQCIAILLSGSLISQYSSCFSWLAPVFGCILAGGGLFWTVGVLVFRKKADEKNISPITATNTRDNDDCSVQVEDVANNNNVNLDANSYTNR